MRLKLNRETAGLRSGITSPRRSPWGKDCGWIRNHRGRDSTYERDGMSTFPGSPRLLKGGIVLLDSTSGAVQRIITLQYNPDTLTRSLQVQAVDQASKNRSQALRLIGPPVE